MALEFESSLNEIDVAFGDIMLKMMQKADGGIHSQHVIILIIMVVRHS